MGGSVWTQGSSGAAETSVCDPGTVLDPSAVLLSGGNYGRTDRDDPDGAEDLSLSGYADSACIGQNSEENGKENQPAGTAGADRQAA